MIIDIIKRINMNINDNNKKIYSFIEYGITSDKYTEEIYNDMKKNYECDNFIIASPSIINDKNNIVIYPEDIFHENPLNAKNIVKFCFYFDIAENKNIENEYYIFFASPFDKLYNKYNSYNKKPLNIFPKYINYLYNSKDIIEKCIDLKQDREGSCFITRKGPNCPHYHRNFDWHPNNSIQLKHSDCYLDNLIKIFNKYKYFYSYDAYTNLIQIASLCGCIPIIIPFGNYNNIKDFWPEEKWFHYGIVYQNCNNYLELDENILNNAIESREKLRDEIKKIDSTNFDSLFLEVYNSINNFFINKYDKIIINDIFNYHNYNEIPIVVLKLKKNINNNKILILTNKINKDSIFINNYDITFNNDDNDNDINKILNSQIYNFVFIDKPLNNIYYKFQTHIYLNMIINNYKKYNFINLSKYKFFDSVSVNTEVNYNLNNFYKISDYQHSYRPNFGKSKILLYGKINYDHWIIKNINNIGKNLYNRNINLIDIINPCDINNPKYQDDTNNTNNICIYFETTGNPLKMKNIIHWNWFFDIRNKDNEDPNTLYVSQFNYYNFKENIYKQKYEIPIDLNSYYNYPNCFNSIFNTDLILNLLKNNNSNTKNTNCYSLRKVSNQHPLKIINSIEKYFIHPNNYELIDNIGGGNGGDYIIGIINLFKKSNEFYCYDNVSFTPVMAKASKCQPILINNYPGLGNIRQFYKLYAPWMFYSSKYYFTDQIDNIQNQSDNSENILNNNDFNIFFEKIHNSTYNDFIFSSDKCEKNIIEFLKYLEVYFNISF